MELYHNLAYGNVRLTGTIVRKKSGAPVIVDGVGGLREVSVTDLRTMTRETIRYEDLDITPVPLGYVNYNRSCYYLSRSPVRNDWRQGLRDKSMVWRYHAWDEYANVYSELVKNGRDIGVKSEAIAKTIINDYPAVKRAIDFVGRDPNPSKSMAFSRDFAIRGDLALLFRNTRVGDIVDQVPVLLDEYFWLRESLQEIMK